MSEEKETQPPEEMTPPKTFPQWAAERSIVFAPAAHRVELMLDDLDHEAVCRAVGRRLSFAQLPDHESNEFGAAVAEICRGWEEMLDASIARRRREEPK